MAPDAPAPDIKRKRSKRKRKTDALEHQEDLSLEEHERRLRQRYLRDLALKLRAQGTEYNPKKHKGKKAFQDPTGKIVMVSGHKPRNAAKLQLVLIPITWDKREWEAQQVLDAVAKVQEGLRTAGVKCDTDSSTKLTPGQKYRHWEEKGVMLRVEIGPEDARKGTCVLAKAVTAGQVAQKRTMLVGSQLVNAVVKELGLPPPPTAAPAPAPVANKTTTTNNNNNNDIGIGSKQRKGGEDSATPNQQVQQPIATDDKNAKKKEKSTRKKDKGAKEEEESVAVVEVHSEPTKIPSPSQKKQHHKSGDDLDGDFGALVEQLEAEKAGVKKGGKKGSSVKKGAAAGGDEGEAGGEVLEGWPAADNDNDDDDAKDGGSKKKKKVKEVKF